ncbi:MAG TPA: CHAT domain-containing protein [Pyrinomonadaceae bacterium]
MGDTRSAYSEVVVRIVPARRAHSHRLQETDESGTGGGGRRYNVLVYTELPLPDISTNTEPPAGQPRTLAGLPFAGRERIGVIWDHYEEFLAAFVEGNKTLEHMRERLLEAVPPVLEALFGAPPQSARPVRVWWSCESPELDDLPWELAAYSARAADPQNFYFVRGLPPSQPAPAIPFTPPLRLALLHQPQHTHPSLLDAFSALPPSIQLVPLDGPPHKVLEEVAREGYELLHIVSDGVVSLGHEGILLFHGAGESGRQVSPGELSSLLRGSRVGLVCLSTQDYGNPDYMNITGRRVPSAYRAFTYLGGSRLPLPTVVTPLGPLKQGEARNFWGSFYENLAQSLSPQRAFNHAQAACGTLPVALFLRHTQDVLFRDRPQAASPDAPDPTDLGAALSFSHELIAQLRTHRETYGEVSEGLSQFIASEEERQQELSEALDKWFETEEGQSNES